MKAELTQLCRRGFFAASWLCLGFAAFCAVVWYFWCPVSRDFGVIRAQATFDTMRVIPPFLLASAVLLRLSRRAEHRYPRLLYWVLVAVTMFVWLLTFKDFYERPTRGWDIILGGR